MIGALTTAISGLKNAAARVDAAATRIVRAGITAGNAVNADPATPVPPATPPASGAPLNAAPVFQDDLLGGILDLKQAEIAYKANAKVVASVGDLKKTLLDTLS